MNSNKSISFIVWRYYFTLVFILLVVIGLGYRIFSLAILDQKFLRQQGDERVVRLVNTPAFRGMIVDRNGFPLAVSTAVFSAWINPKEFTPEKKQVDALAKLLGMKARDIYSIALLSLKKNREFVYLKRSLSPVIAGQIKLLSIPGIYLQAEFHRYYPEGEITAQVVGLTNVDDQGQEGLELAYNDWLQGEPGKKWVIKDRLGRIISDIQTVSEQKPGHDLVLSIDRRIQYIAYRELMKSVLENEAQSGSAVVVNAKTGEVLAMVNYPSYNPNNRQVTKKENMRNRALTDSFEPGSTIKPFSVARALESGLFKPTTMIDTAPGWLRLGHNIVKDEHYHGQGLLSVTEILQRSSNVGISKMILGLPPDLFWSLLHRAGFGEISGIGFPGEQSGSLVKHNRWGEFVYANYAIGYGISVTVMQLAHAYTILANSGSIIPVTLLKQETPVKSEPVISPHIANQVLSLLEFVVEGKGGTGEQAKVEGYRVGGKTGTSQMVIDGVYQRHHHTSSFVGIAPLSNPQFIVAVVIHDPQGKHYYGGKVSGPTFAKITENTLRLLDVSPDAPIAS